MFVTLATLPNASSTLSSIGDYSSEMFSSFLPFAYLLIGFVVGGLLLHFVIMAIVNGIEWLFPDQSIRRADEAIKESRRLRGL